MHAIVGYNNLYINYSEEVIKQELKRETETEGYVESRYWKTMEMMSNKLCFAVVMTMVLTVSTFAPAAYGNPSKNNIAEAPASKPDAKCDAKIIDANNLYDGNFGVAAPMASRLNEESLALMSGRMKQPETSGGVGTINGCRGNLCNFLVAPCQIGCVCVPINIGPYGFCSGVCC